MMKVVHVLKRLEAIDLDIKELKKLEKSIDRSKSFSTPIYMSIEKQINIMLGERVKLMELTIANPPAELAAQFDEKDGRTKQSQSDKQNKKPQMQIKKPVKREPISFDSDLPMFTQDKIDSKMDFLIEERKKDDAAKHGAKKGTGDDVKLLDIALEKGSLNTDEFAEKDKKVRFFRDNFPIE